ncbi:Transcription elongation factor GreA [Candidatus Hodgkinia cicadicola]|nr:Transcription elongation factor GreA [Candidatus Hodgkinia cicadicola]
MMHFHYDQRGRDIARAQRPNRRPASATTRYDARAAKNQNKPPRNKISLYAWRTNWRVSRQHALWNSTCYEQTEPTMLNLAIAPTTDYSNLFRQLNWREQHEKPRLKTQLGAASASGGNRYAAKKEDETNEINATPITTAAAPFKTREESRGKLSLTLINIEHTVSSDQVAWARV